MDELVVRRGRWLVALCLVVACGPRSDDPNLTDTGSGSSSESDSTDAESSMSSGASSTSAASAGSGSGSSSSSSSSSSSTGSTTNGEGLEACSADEDCMLGGCCPCVALPASEDPLPCADDCDQTQCESAGIEAAVCRLGVCVVDKVRCDAYAVACDAAPPSCGDGLAPVVSNGCWSGACVPWTLCEFVPDCTACRDTEICVQQVSGPASVWTPITCEPIPPACGTTPSCACAEDVCAGIGDCLDQDDGSITCLGT